MTASATIGVCWLPFDLTFRVTLSMHPNRTMMRQDIKSPLSHMTETEGGTLALQLEKGGSEGAMFETGNTYMSFESSVGEGLNSFLMTVGIARLCPFFLLQCR